MRLKTRFAVTMLLFGSILGAVGLATTVLNRRARIVAGQGEIADRIALLASQLNYLAGDYLIHRGSQVVPRWHTSFASFSHLLDSLKANTPEQKALQLDIRENSRRLREVFESVIVSPKGASLQVPWSRMSVQTLGIIADASSLSRLLREEADRLERTGAYFLYAFFGIICLFFLFNFALTYRQTVRSLNLLRAGARVIGSGDLDFRITTGSHDEISEVAEAFNQMTRDLKSITISKAKLEERVLERSGEIASERRRLLEVLETLPAMICLLTPDHQIAFANRSFRERFGESEGRPCYECCFGKSAPCELCQSYQVLETGQPRHWEITTPDGSMLDAHAFPFQDADGLPMILEMDIDISARARAEAQIRQYQDHLEDLVKERTAAVRDREEGLRALYRNMSEGLAMHDIVCEDGKAVDYILTDVNPAFETITGLPREAAVGRRASELYGTGQPPYLEVYSQVATGGGPRRFETYFAAMGKHFDISAFSFQQGRFATVFTDITERKKAEAEVKKHSDEIQVSNIALVQARRAALNIMEDALQAREALRQLNETLEKRVAERTELAESRARQLQALAAQLIEAEEQERQRVSQLLHDDLQQVLAATRFQAEAASLRPNPGPLLANVLSLLDESIGKTRQLSHELSPAVLHHSDLAGVLDWLARQVKQQFGLELETEAGAAPPSLSMPLRVFVFRAMQELLFNVVKHAGVSKARASTRACDGHLLITVSDQGRGFNPGILDTPGGSTGFGLLSLRERASYIGGSLRIEAAPGRGSRFTLRIPLGQEGPAPEPPPGPGGEGEVPDPGVVTGSEPIRVLFADDHRVLRQGLMKLLAGRPDVQVVGEAASGREALERARQLRPDVVVMDVSMPGMDGIEATRLIKAELPVVQVVGLSVFEQEEVARRMRQAGAESLVSKSASSGELLKAIHRAASAGRSKPAPP